MRTDKFLLDCGSATYVGYLVRTVSKEMKCNTNKQGQINT